MDAQSILKSLSNLEQKLKTIESARQQVEKTVNAYEGAKAQLTILTNDFKDIYQELNNVLSEIQNSKNNVSTEVSEKADAVFKVLHTRTVSLEQDANTIKQDFVSACNTANENFSKSIEKSEKDLVDAMLANLNEVRKETVKEIEKVSGIVTAFSTAVTEIQDNYKQELSSSTENQKNLMGQITTEFSKSVEQYIVSMRNVKTEMDSILERYNSASDRVEEKMGQLEVELKTVIDKLSTKIDEKSNTILDKCNTHATGITDVIDKAKNELKENANKISSEIASSSSANKESAKRINDKIDSVLTQLLDANAKSHKLIVILVIGLIVSLLLNILAIAKVF